MGIRQKGLLNKRFLPWAAFFSGPFPNAIALLVVGVHFFKGWSAQSLFDQNLFGVCGHNVSLAINLLSQGGLIGGPSGWKTPGGKKSLSFLCGKATKT